VLRIFGNADLKDDPKGQSYLEIRYMIYPEATAEREALQKIAADWSTRGGAKVDMTPEGLSLWAMIPIPAPKAGAAHA